MVEGHLGEGIHIGGTPGGGTQDGGVEGHKMEGLRDTWWRTQSAGINYLYCITDVVTVIAHKNVPHA
jgi:hypothetical protein